MKWLLVALMPVLAIGFVALGIIASVFRDEWKLRRKRRALEQTRDRLLEERAQLLAQLPKGKILKVGQILEIAPGQIIVEGWEIIWPIGKPEIRILSDDSTLWCGYSIPELREISARKAEFEP